MLEKEVVVVRNKKGSRAAAKKYVFIHMKKTYRRFLISQSLGKKSSFSSHAFFISAFFAFVGEPKNEGGEDDKYDIHREAIKKCSRN